ncbi:hypothetical protein CTEN210_00528 [Chaetoceros tenuissimus]|uniref:Uncharacterized protein n=1 Tax=Chaetoceros tenuissimus TaxID=426638 RepID=A0AAD3CFP8_9STRA|nr:hypothetical protein CTEN210_00528 [Chaetoceros tenuissimus]
MRVLRENRKHDGGLLFVVGLSMLFTFTSAQGCVDSSSFEYNTIKNNVTKPNFCGWLKEKPDRRPERYCKEHLDVVINCPEACESYSPNSCSCSDTPNYQFLGINSRKTYDCDWITKSNNITKTEKRVELYCSPEQNQTAINCLRNTCGLCTPQPSFVPSITTAPSSQPSAAPVAPTNSPSRPPSPMPSPFPTLRPTNAPTRISESPSNRPSVTPSDSPSSIPSVLPSTEPSSLPSTAPSSLPSSVPSLTFSDSPSLIPSQNPSASPSRITPSPSTPPTETGTNKPSSKPSNKPSRSCTDDSSFQFYHNTKDKQKSCSWLGEDGKASTSAEKIAEYCVRGDVKGSCSSTCSFCTCENDSSATFEHNGKTKDCAWIDSNASKTTSRRDLYCYNDKTKNISSDIGNKCVSSCGFCQS